MMKPSQLSEQVRYAMQRAGCHYPLGRAHRVPFGVPYNRAPYTGNGAERDPNLQGCIELHCYDAVTTEPLDKMVAVLSALPGLVRIRVIRGPQDYIGRERDLRPQVRAWVND